jgi:hypothetical protein
MTIRRTSTDVAVSTTSSRRADSAPDRSAWTRRRVSTTSRIPVSSRATLRFISSMSSLERGQVSSRSGMVSMMRGFTHKPTRRCQWFSRVCTVTS